ncbi:MAG: NADH-quinone oxidoreductase subunit F, partial [Actinobacteria bacterium]|nr:NADH-quinone oxidoreductase subunit F [Actinomycetota bacterium]
MITTATGLLDSVPAAGLPAVTAAELTALVEQAGLRGRGGASFPTATKLRAVAGARDLVVVGNAMEGEPLSAKDAVLLRRAPHLVVEGLLVVGRALGAARLVIGAGTHVPVADLAPVASAHGVKVVVVPGGFISGQESALARGLSGRAAVPTDPATRVTTRGVDGRPTLVLNVETLAQVARVVRHGPAAADTALFTLSGALSSPGVVEAPWTSTIADIVDRGHPSAIRAVLVGGYHGTWMAHPDLDVPAASVAVGAGVLHMLPPEVCPLRATGAIAAYLAAESAGQCGPCINALPRVADTMLRLASTTADPRLPAEV